MDNNQVLSLIKEKDEKGLNYLYDNYSASLNGIIVRIVENDKAAEEVLQQTFLKIWEKINLYDPKKSTLFTWMARIARNSAIDLKRTKKFKQNHVTESWQDMHNDSKLTHNDNAKIDTQKILMLIEPKYKTVIDCIYLQGYSHSEAAKKLDLPLGTVKSRIRNGLKELRGLLETEKSLFVSSFVIFIYLILCL